jgi:hypothetical protein
MRYEFTCNYETSLDYLSTIVSSSKKEQKILLDTFKNNGYLSVDTKKFFKEMTQISFDIGDLEVWFNPLVVDLAKELLLNDKVTKGTEIKETLQLLQDEDQAWDVFPEDGSGDFIRSYLNPLTSKNPYNEHLEGIPYAPAGGRFGAGFANMLQERYDNGTLLEYPINDILLIGMGNGIKFKIIDTYGSQEMRGTVWTLYSQEKDWFYGAGWAVFKIPLQHPSKPFMNWELESPWEAKE